MKKSSLCVMLLLLFAGGAFAGEAVSLAGTWRFRLDPKAEGLPAGVVSVAGEEPLPKGPALPVKKAKFHSFEKLRSGRIKTGRGWNVADFAMSVFNPSLTKTIKVTFTLIADDPNFVYKNGQKGTWTRVHDLEPDMASTDNVVQGEWYPGGKFPVPGDSHWTGRAEFSSDEPFYTYILLFPDIEGPDSAKAIKKGEMVWSDEVQGLWDEERKQLIFPYTNYWQNDPYWLGGWHTRLILVNRSESPVVYKVSHRPNYWARKNKEVSITVPLKEESIEVNLAPGERKAAWLEDLFGWPKGLTDSMEGRLCVTPAPDSAREKCEVKLYVLPDKVSVESLKEAEKKALSDDAGVVVHAGGR